MTDRTSMGALRQIKLVSREGKRSTQTDTSLENDERNAFGADGVAGVA